MLSLHGTGVVDLGPLQPESLEEGTRRDPPFGEGGPSHRGRVASHCKHGLRAGGRSLAPLSGGRGAECTVGAIWQPGSLPGPIGGRLLHTHPRAHTS
jgi:hypothetical protein